MVEVMKKALFAISAFLLISGLSLEAKQRRVGTLTFDVRDKREIITRGIDKDLLLRVRRACSVTQEYFGWDVEVVRNPVNVNASNLLYHSRRWHGPHPSHVYAWHIGARLFRDEREIEVRGYPYVVKIVLLNPVVEGEGTDRRFVSGKVKISWGQKP